MNYIEKLKCLRAQEAREAKKVLADEIKSVNEKINSCNSVKELQELKQQATQTLKRFEGLKKDLQPFGLWSLDDRNKLDDWNSFWAE